MALSVAGSLSAHAGVSFQNNGTVTNWSNYPQSPAHGNITEVSSPVYGGSTAIRFYQPFEGTNGSSYHCEVDQTPVNPVGSTCYYGFALYLPADFKFSTNQDLCFSQWARSDQTSPWTLMFLHNHEIHTGGSGGLGRTWGAINAGVWNRIIVKIVNSSTSGELTVWVNGIQSGTSFTGNITPGGPAIRWSTGQYCTWWKTHIPNGSNPMITYEDHFRIASTYAEADPANWTESGGSIDPAVIYQLQNEASGLVLNQQGSLTNGSAITQWSSASTSQNLQWKFIPTSNGYYQINSVRSGKDTVVQSASTSAGAPIIQWSFGSSGDDQWKPVQNSDGSYTFYNLHSGLVLEDPGSSTSTSTQMDQWTPNGGANQKWKLLAQ